jgi:hypothetical protein
MVIFFLIQIYSQNSHDGSLPFYPYFFSTNIDYSYYNYFSGALHPFQSTAPNNIVYTHPIPFSAPQLPKTDISLPQISSGPA